MKKSIVIVLLTLAFGCSKEEGQTEERNLPPTAFQVTVETNGTAATLNWTAAQDPEGNNVTYSVLLGTETMAENLTVTSYDLHNLNFSTDYQGSVIASDETGLETSSSYNFSTEEEPNSAPSQAVLLTPANNDNTRGIVQLSWNAAIDAEGDSVTYDVFVNYNGYANFGNDFTLFAEALDDTTIPFQTSTGFEAQINWFVVAKDSKGLSSTSETFTFRTVEETLLFPHQDNPPFQARDNHGLVQFNDKFY